MELSFEPVLYGDEVVGLGHLVCVNILATAASQNLHPNVPHIILCKEQHLRHIAHIANILSPNICFVPLSDIKYTLISSRSKDILYSFEYFCKNRFLEALNGSNRPIYGAQWNLSLEFLGKNSIPLYNENYNNIPLLSEIYPDTFGDNEKIAVVNARTTPCDTYARNSDPNKLQPLINLLKERNFKIVRLGANYSSAELYGVDLDLSGAWSSGLELSSLKSAFLVVGGLTGITILSGMLGITTLLYDCPTPIQTYLFHNFPNHYILFKKPPPRSLRHSTGIYEYFSLATHEYTMLGLEKAENGNNLIGCSLLADLIPNVSNELCAAVNYMLDNDLSLSSDSSGNASCFKSEIHRRTGLRSSHNKLFPEYIYE